MPPCPPPAIAALETDERQGGRCRRLLGSSALSPASIAVASGVLGLALAGSAQALDLAGADSETYATGSGTVVDQFAPYTNSAAGAVTLRLRAGTGATLTEAANSIAEGGGGAISVAIGNSAVGGSTDGTVEFLGANTYSGGTTIANGATLRVNPPGGLGSGTVTNDGTLVFGNGIIFSNDYAVDAGQTGAVTALSGLTVTMSGGFDVGSGATLAFGSGSDTGTIVLQPGSASTSSFNLAVNGGTLDDSLATSGGSASAISVASGATYKTGGGAFTLTNLTGAGTITNGAATNATITLAGATSFSGQIDDGTNGTVGLKVTSGSVTLSGGSLGFTGGLEVSGGSTIISGGGQTMAGGITISGGSLELSGDNSGMTSTINVGGELILGADNAAGGAGGSIKTTGSTITYADGVNSATPIEIASNTTQLNVDGSDSATQSGVISEDSAGRPLTKIGTGTLTLNAANTYTGMTTVSAGTLSLSGGAAIADTGAVTVNSGAKLDLASSETIGSLAGAGVVTLNANTLTTGAATSTTFMGTISGAGGLTKQGTGTFTLASTNSYTGTTTVNAGTLSVSGAGSIASTTIFVDNTASLNVDGGALSSSAAVTLNDHANLTLSGNETIGSLAAGATGTNTTVSLGSGTTLTTGGDNSSTEFQGVISGAGGLTKAGSGAFSLAGTNTYSGTTTVNAGTLDVTGSINNSTTVSVNNAAVLKAHGNSIANSAAVTLNDTSNLTLAGSETIGGLAGASGSTVTLGANTLTTGGNNASTTFSGQISGTGSLVKQGTGTFTLSGSNGFTGGTTVSAGTLIVASGGGLGGVTNASGATFEVQSGGSAGAASNAGTLTNSGVLASLSNTGGSATNNGTVSGAATVSGGAFANNGTVSGASSLSGGTTNNYATMTGLVTLTGGLLNTSGTLEGGLTNNGGAVNASGTAKGTIAHNSGSFSLTGNLTGDGQFNNAATLDLAGYSLSGFTGFANNSGTVNFASGSGISVGAGTISSSGTLNFAGSNTLTGGLFNVTGGSLDMDNAAVGDTLAVTGDFNLGAGATWIVNVDHLEQNDAMSVNGSVTLAGGLSVQALPPESSYPAGPASLEYMLITNDGSDAVSGAFSGVTTNYAFLAPSVSYVGGDGNDVVLTLDIPSTAPDFAPFATNWNQTQTALALADFDYSSTDGTEVLDAFNLLTNGQVPGVLDQVGGAGHMASFQMDSTVFGSFLGGISSHLRSLRSLGKPGVAPSAYVEGPQPVAGNAIGEVYGKTDLASNGGPVFWAEGQATYKRVDSDGNGPGMRLNGGNALMGAEYDTGKGDVFGAAFGYARSGFTNEGLAGSAKADSYQLGFYGEMGAADPLETGAGLTGAFGYAWHLHDTTREISIGSLSREATADYRAESYGGEVIASYGFAQAASGAGEWTLSPYAGLNYVHTHNGAFAESGAGTLNLSSAAFSTDQLKSLLGIRIAGRLAGEDRSVRPSASIGWRHEFLDPNVTGTFALAGSPTQFQTVSAGESRDEFVAALGMDVDLAANSRLRLGANTSYSTSQLRLGASAELSTSF